MKYVFVIFVLYTIFIYQFYIPFCYLEKDNVLRNKLLRCVFCGVYIIILLEINQEDEGNSSLSIVVLFYIKL